MKDYSYIEKQINEIIEGVLFGENRIFDIKKGDIVIEVKSCKEFFKTGEKFNRGKIIINVDSHRENLINYGDNFKYIIAIKDEKDNLVYFFMTSGNEINRIMQNKKIYTNQKGLNVIQIYHNEIIDIEYIKYITDKN